MELLIQGDCLDVLKGMPDNSVDSVVTDPPYGLSKEPDIREVLTKWMNGEDYHHRGGGFMGKSWDSFVPGPSIWREVFRLLKPGGHLLCFAGTRTQDLMTISLRLAGFEIRDVIEWLYASGFPKSMDVGKQFDKRGGAIADFEEFRDACLEALKQTGKTRKRLQELLGNHMISHYLSKGSQPAVPVYRDYVIIRDYLELGNRFDKYFKEAAEREKIGESENGIAGGTKRHAGQEKAYGFNKTYDITAPATDLAKKWDGWGTALKPAHEPIIMARKPLEKNVAYNVEKYGTGALNIDGCRIYSEEKPQTIRNAGGIFLKDGFSTIEELKAAAEKGEKTPNGRDARKTLKRAERESVYVPDEKGRFPANCVTLEDDQFYSKYFNITPPELSKKASKKDRNSDWRGNEISGEAKQVERINQLPDGFVSSYGNVRNKPKPQKNHHPTVKPTDLMAWLIKLITPPGGIVLDPFAGSGSTLVAAKREGFSFIGIEKEPEYIEIAKARVGA